LRAVRLLRYGAPLIAQDIADPVPRSGELLIEIRAAGICHSDGFYRSEPGRVPLPRTLGHEVAGVIAGTDRRVAVHYLIGTRGDMIGKEFDGGFAEKIVVPAENAIPIPDHITFEQAAIMMCSTATVYHALRLASFQPNEFLAILGFGGLGISALQLARHLGAAGVYVTERVPEKLALAADMGAVPGLPEGIDVALDFIGKGDLCVEALRALRPGGRLMLVAINLREMRFDPYADVLTKERRIIGCSDHTREELIELMQMDLDLSRAITRRVPLEAGPINSVLDELERGTPHMRTVITI
jgi:D-arabinose 1-dehydrogenase-like Zn-dependent alcohol dehydrogenase